MSEPDVSDLLTVQQAIAIIDAVEVSPRVVTVPLAQAAGLVLAQNLLADRDFPPFDKSQMDGYAVRAGDVGEGTTLKITGEVAAGALASVAVGAGEAVAIMTGAPMPPGADSVVPVEDVVVDGERLRINARVTPGRYIARRGSDCAASAPVLPQGIRLGPAQLAVAAAVGATQLRVFEPPRVAILSTGDEIVPIDQTPGASQIRNSNSPMLAALLTRLGCAVTDLGHVRDDPALIQQAIARAAGMDALFVTGGMSMGRYDYVPQILRKMSYRLAITKLRIKPGKPFVFGFGVPGSGFREDSGPEPGTRNPEPASFVFGLPGNPVSAFVCTLRLASRLLARMSGTSPDDHLRVAKLALPLPANGPREFYQPAEWAGQAVRPMNWKGSADIFTLARADVLIVRPENQPSLPAGAEVQVLEVPR